MKPGDHPDFFRFPAPPGRSRESSIVLDRMGRFWHEGALVEHPGMTRAFASWIGRHPDDGRFILSNGFDWTYFTVEDVPFLVVGIQDSGGIPEVQLSDGSQEPLALETLTEDSRGAIYCWVKGGSFEARLTPEAQNRLAPWLVEDADAGVALEVAQKRFTVAERS